MPALTCRRCGQQREGLDQPPFRGKLGLAIHESVCRPCWIEWEAAQTKIINEARLSLGNPRHQEYLDSQLRAFLNLPA